LCVSILFYLIDIHWILFSFHAGTDANGKIRSLPLPNLDAVTRESAKDYFDNSWTLYETLFAGMKGEEGFYRYVWAKKVIWFVQAFKKKQRISLCTLSSALLPTVFVIHRSFTTATLPVFTLINSVSVVFWRKLSTPILRVSMRLESMK
jgi:hypothetical protein